MMTRMIYCHLVKFQDLHVISCVFWLKLGLKFISTVGSYHGVMINYVILIQRLFKLHFCTSIWVILIAPIKIHNFKISFLSIKNAWLTNHPFLQRCLPQQLKVRILRRQSDPNPTSEIRFQFWRKYVFKQSVWNVYLIAIFINISLGSKRIFLLVIQVLF